jgi:hypothetical protein
MIVEQKIIYITKRSIGIKHILFLFIFLLTRDGRRQVNFLEEQIVQVIY